MRFWNSHVGENVRGAMNCATTNAFFVNDNRLFIIPSPIILDLFEVVCNE